jgi:hypothetical protein
VGEVRRPEAVHPAKTSSERAATPWAVLQSSLNRAWPILCPFAAFRIRTRDTAMRCEATRQSNASAFWIASPRPLSEQPGLSGSWLSSDMGRLAGTD